MVAILANRPTGRTAQTLPTMTLGVSAEDRFQACAVSK